MREAKAEASRGEGPGERLAFGLLVLFGMVMYTSPAEWIAGAAQLRLALVSASLAAGLMVLRRLVRQQPLYLDGVRGTALLGFALLTLASTAWSIDPLASRAVAVEMLKLWLIF